MAIFPLTLSSHMYVGAEAQCHTVIIIARIPKKAKFSSVVKNNRSGKCKHTVGTMNNNCGCKSERKLVPGLRILDLTVGELRSIIAAATAI